jgi:hypothetical protein
MALPDQGMVRATLGWRSKDRSGESGSRNVSEQPVGGKPQTRCQPIQM